MLYTFGQKSENVLFQPALRIRISDPGLQATICEIYLSSDDPDLDWIQILVLQTTDPQHWIQPKDPQLQIQPEVRALKKIWHFCKPKHLAIKNKEKNFFRKLQSRFTADLCCSYIKLRYFFEVLFYSLEDLIEQTKKNSKKKF